MQRNSLGPRLHDANCLKKTQLACAISHFEGLINNEKTTAFLWSLHFSAHSHDQFQARRAGSTLRCNSISHSLEVHLRGKIVLSGWSGYQLQGNSTGLNRRFADIPLLASPLACCKTLWHVSVRSVLFRFSLIQKEIKQKKQYSVLWIQRALGHQELLVLHVRRQCGDFKRRTLHIGSSLRAKLILVLSLHIGICDTRPETRGYFLSVWSVGFCSKHTNERLSSSILPLLKFILNVGEHWAAAPDYHCIIWLVYNLISRNWMLTNFGAAK